MLDTPAGLLGTPDLLMSNQDCLVRFSLGIFVTGESTTYIYWFSVGMQFVPLLIECESQPNLWKVNSGTTASLNIRGVERAHLWWKSVRDTWRVRLSKCFGGNRHETSQSKSVCDTKRRELRVPLPPLELASARVLLQRRHARQCPRFAGTTCALCLYVQRHLQAMHNTFCITPALDLIRRGMGDFSTAALFGATY